MKKFLLFATLFTTATMLKAQSLENINFLLIQKKINEAKVGLDKFMLDPKQAAKPDVLFLKGNIYNELSMDPKALPADAYNNKIIAFEAFKKYTEVDKKGKLMIEQDNFPLTQIYAGFTELGGVDFNSKNFSGAINNYVKAQEVEDFILQTGLVCKQLKLNKLDTNLILNTAAAAINNNDSTMAVKYYSKLVDAGVNEKDQENIYDLVVRYYMGKKDMANFSSIIAKAQKIYPSNPYWTELELEYLAKNDRPAMFAKYEQNYVKDPTNKINTANYGIELYNKYYDSKANNKDSAASVKLIAILKAASKNGDESNNTNVLLANHLYNTAATYSDKADKIKSVKPADVKRKKDLTTLSVAALNELIPFALNSIAFFKGQANLKSGQKANYRSAAGYLAEAYRATKNVAKAAEYEKLMTSIIVK